MKKLILLIGTISLMFAACERHPVSQIPKEGDDKEAAKSDVANESGATPSPSGTPKTYFPKN
jgi:hypothetical protein